MLYPRFVFTIAALVLLASMPHESGAQSPTLKGEWTKSKAGGVHETISIRGTRNRNNPLRRQLAEPFTGDQLYVHFRLIYDVANLDSPAEGDGEFFVLWCDDKDGGDGAVHAGAAPNVGVHVDGQRNKFMARFKSNEQRFSNIELKGGQEYRVIARLAKTTPGVENPYDQLSLWVDPTYHQRESPDVTASNPQAVSTIEWFGFSTGAKTEPQDRIEVSDIRVATSWREALGLPAATKAPAMNADAVMPQVTKQTVDFATNVLPILKQHCFQCHAGDDPEAGLRLDVVDEVLNQVTPHDGLGSHLISLLRSKDDDKRMPPPSDAPLDDQSIETLITWIDEGLAWDEHRLPIPTPSTDHWAFQPIQRPSVPEPDKGQWVRTPIDTFIADAHQQKGLSAANVATPASLARRISLGLTGLPPDQLPGNVDTHEYADQLVEELLSTVQYGERWGRHWLDLARFGESNGHQHNRDRPYAWRYRDYVVQSFVDDLPFDQFVRQQIAGDETEFSTNSLIATGFLAAARYSGNELDEEIQRNDILVDIVNTTAESILGVTMACAQCHTHKFDPFSIRDYYRFQAFFSRGQPANIVLQSEPEMAEQLISARWEMFDDVHARVTARRRKAGTPEPVLVIPKSVVGAMKGTERELFQQLEDKIQELPQTWGWHSPGSTSTPLVVAPHEMRWPLPRDPETIRSTPTFIRVRGEVKSHGPEVQPGWPAVFGPSPDQLAKPRTALADWLTSADNPLTARVWVNRIWQWHFGVGLVATSGDFGTQGAKPSHPRLLDWLASELMESGWSTKHIHRLILNSNTYRQSADFTAANQQIDPDNRMLWCWRPHRLEAEAIRDSILTVAGALDTQVGGPSVPAKLATESRRRSIYLQQKRDRMPEDLMLFDAANGVNTCSRRRVSTVSLQPLYLMNSDFVNEMAQAFAARVRNESTSKSEYVQNVFRIALARDANEEEKKRSAKYLEDHTLESFCLAIMNLSEFIYQ